MECRRVVVRTYHKSVNAYLTRSSGIDVAQPLEMVTLLVAGLDRRKTLRGFSTVLFQHASQLSTQPIDAMGIIP